MCKSKLLHPAPWGYAASPSITRPAGAVRGGITPAGTVQPAPAPAMAGAGMVLTRPYHAMMTVNGPTGWPHATPRMRAWARVA
ncbi:hypothetical protein [Komagataeibacter sp. FXV3]|uniref:hypothetical protein n=1 Tax=Komagataeibacter sp. FXV3 TaxID=2608998 RepID=UPI001D111E0D|nr:hypothetical protein [Komagataeibacter sp. FXV3]